MALPPLIYVGTAGLEAQIFQTYMAASGYQVRTVTTRDGVLAAVSAKPTAIVVIALDKSQTDLTELAREVRERANSSKLPIFILNGDQDFDPQVDAVYVILRPFRLSEVIGRIQSLARRKKAVGD